MKLNKLQEKIKFCKKCDLYKTRASLVFAKGNPYSKIMICGMCPGADENTITNKAGLPFIGRSGKLLDKALIDSELSLRDVYITNLIKCFIQPGFKLEEEWINNCFPYLVEQINAIEPMIILALGGDVSRALLNKTPSTSLSSMRGKRYKFTEKISIVVTYHPSYLVRLGGIKHKVYKKFIDDLSWCKEIIERK